MGKDKVLADMSDEEFMDSWTALGDEVQAGKDWLRKYSHEHQRRTRKAQLANAVGEVSESDLALLQEMQAEGVESQAAVGSDD